VTSARNVPAGVTKQDTTGLHPAGFVLGRGSNRTATYQQAGESKRRGFDLQEPEEATKQKLLEPLLQALGFTSIPITPANSKSSAIPLIIFSNPIVR